MSSQEKAIERLKVLLTQYQRGGGKYLEQTSRTGPSWADYEGGSFTKEISRGQLLEDAKNSETDLEKLFVWIMAWGFGPAGYAHYRTIRILDEVKAVDGRTIISWMTGLRSASKLSPAAAFEFLDSESGRIKYLGLAFATKLLYFLSPIDKRTPILDFVVDSWLRRYKIEIEEESTTFKFANHGGYKKYLEPMASARIN